MVVRHLPPLLPEAALLQTLAPFQADFTDWAFEVGDPALGAQQYARCYMRFRDAAAMARFARAFNGHLFRSAAGEEHRALVDLAPLQTTLRPPPGPPRPDRLAGTLEQDPTYQQFLQQWQRDQEPQPPQPAAAAAEPSPAAAGGDAASAAPESTPLLDYLAALHRRDDAKASKAAAKGKKKAAAAAAALPAAAAAGGPVDKKARREARRAAKLLRVRGDRAHGRALAGH